MPRARLDPVDSVEQSRGTVTSLFGVNTLNVEIPRLCKEIHEMRLDGLGLVNNSFRPDVNSAY